MKIISSQYLGNIHDTKSKSKNISFFQESKTSDGQTQHQRREAIRLLKMLGKVIKIIKNRPLPEGSGTPLTRFTEMLVRMAKRDKDRERRRQGLPRTIENTVSE